MVKSGFEAPKEEDPIDRIVLGIRFSDWAAEIEATIKAGNDPEQLMAIVSPGSTPA
jgi:hypothetical protein